MLYMHVNGINGKIRSSQPQNVYICVEVPLHLRNILVAFFVLFHLVMVEFVSNGDLRLNLKWDLKKL